MLKLFNSQIYPLISTLDISIDIYLVICLESSAKWKAIPHVKNMTGDSFGPYLSTAYAIWPMQMLWWYFIYCSPTIYTSTWQTTVKPILFKIRSKFLKHAIMSVAKQEKVADSTKLMYMHSKTEGWCPRRG